MKKIIVLLMAAIMSVGLVFAGCSQSNTHYENKLDDLSGKVDSNGGFVVVKGNYVYFINGVASNTDDNTFGKPVTGSLVRIKKTALEDAADRTKAAVEAETVIPSLFVAGDLTSGFYMFDKSENVYFASPYTGKNKAGEIENSKLSFIRATLNGKEKNVILTVDDNATAYRFAEKDGTVYLMIKTTVPDENSDDETATRSAIVVYNADNGEKVFTSEAKLGEYDFGDGNDVYYTVTPYDEELEQDEKYNDLYRYDLGSKESVLVATGKGTLGASEDKGGEGLSGATYSVIKNGSDALYVKATYLDTSVATVTQYRAYTKADGKASGTYEVLNYGSETSSKVFTSTSYFASKNCIIYLDSTYGLLAYNYELASDEYNGTPVIDKTATLFYDEDLIGYTVRFWNNGYVYLTDSDNYYYRVKVIGNLINADGTAPSGVDENAKNTKVEKVNFLANSVSWYAAEAIGDYFFSVYTASPYNSLVYVSDMAKNAALDDDAIAEIRKSEKEIVEANLSTCISKVSDDIKKSIKEYIKDTFESEEE